MEQDLMTADQLAQRLGVKPSTVKSWLRAGLIPASRLTSKVIRYDMKEVVTALEERELARKEGRDEG